MTNICLNTTHPRFLFFFFFLMIRRPPRSTPFPTRRSSHLLRSAADLHWDKGNASTDQYGLLRYRSSVAYLEDRKSTRLNSSHLVISYAVFCLKKKKKTYTYASASSSPATHTCTPNLHTLAC